MNRLQRIATPATFRSAKRWSHGWLRKHSQSFEENIGNKEQSYQTFGLNMHTMPSLVGLFLFSYILYQEVASGMEERDANMGIKRQYGISVHSPSPDDIPDKPTDKCVNNPY
jgi:hypothetical protein